MKMKYFLIGICLVFTCLAASSFAMVQAGKAAVKVAESNNIYKLETRYDKAKTRKVQQYMTESLKETGFKFTNAQLDAQLALNGGINFYIKSYDGELVLKFDKRKNNTDDYTKFKKMCEGIKAIIQRD
ncbi:MAG TPA: hypothetical protein VGM63_15820 [Mucilaginibacter sp.]